MNKTKKIKKIIHVKKEEYDKCKNIINNPYIQEKNDNKIVITNNTIKNTKNSIIEIINIPFTNKDITPNNDFYNFINFE